MPLPMISEGNQTIGSRSLASMRIYALPLFATLCALCGCSRNVANIDMVEIPAGTFVMGGNGGTSMVDGRLDERGDEAPAHKVSVSAFRMGACEITNAQYEAFKPEHKALRGKDGVSVGDDEAVVNVSWYDAVEFCKWLSRRTGRRYRLPTEAEWEYACRAGTVTEYFTGDTLPPIYLKNQEIVRDYAPVSLEVGQTPPNAYGLYDMHGNVEEWCLDWYGAYPDAQTDTVINPSGPKAGEFRVTRGGSHNTPVEFLRSSNRMAMLPADKHSLTGFRIVESDFIPADSRRDKTAPLPKTTNVLRKNPVSEKVGSQDDRTDGHPLEPLFAEPIPYVIPPTDGSPFYSHNHQPAIACCDNGDLLAIWFSANAENGREMVVLGSRLRAGTDAWEPATLFYKVPDRNMTGSSLLNDGEGRLLHFNGVEAAGDWQNLAMIMRVSEDNGLSWSEAKIIAPWHTKRHQVIPGTIKTREGYLIQLCDAGADGNDGAAFHISRDGGKTWTDPAPTHDLPEFTAGGSGHTIAGIHAGIVQLADGSLMTLGRGNSIADRDGSPRMPLSRSSDWGVTWTYEPGPFPPIGGGQRLVLLRLHEGPILLISFTDTGDGEGMEFIDRNGSKYTGHGMFAALSYDEGATWPVRKLFTDGQERELDGGAWTGVFHADATHAEPKGYLAVTQSPDGTIHVLSSRLHYRINLSWIEE